MLVGNFIRIKIKMHLLAIYYIVYLELERENRSDFASTVQTGRHGFRSSFSLRHHVKPSTFVVRHLLLLRKTEANVSASTSRSR